MPEFLHFTAVHKIRISEYFKSHTKYLMLLLFYLIQITKCVPTRTFRWFRQLHFQQDRQCMYNTEACSCYHRCSRKGINITYSACVFVASCILHTKLILHVLLSGLSASKMYFHIIS